MFYALFPCLHSAQVNFKGVLILNSPHSPLFCVGNYKDAGAVVQIVFQKKRMKQVCTFFVDTASKYQTNLRPT